MLNFWSFLLIALALCSAQNPNPMEDILNNAEWSYKDEQARPANIPSPDQPFDFIIVGAGTAGSVLAHRLTENPNWNVLLIEAGGSETVLNEIPVLAGVVQLTESNWKYLSTPQRNACLGHIDKRCALPTGKGLGGSSAINFMIYNRGNRQDWDNMAAVGNNGWSYDEVLPYFLRSERASLGALNFSPFHNTSGLQSVEYPTYRSPMAEAFVKAFTELKYPEVDYNGEHQQGTSFVQGMTLNGRRHSAAKAFLTPIINERRNLRVLTFCHVTKILIDQNYNAVGVELLHKNVKYSVRATKEVIVSAGALNSPKLLMLSGIGPVDALGRAGIHQLINIPVGKRLSDHMSHVGPVFTTNATGSTLYLKRITPNDVTRYQAGDPATMLSSLSGIEALSVIDLPDISLDGRPGAEIIFVAASFALDNGFTFIKNGNFREDIYNIGYKGLEGTEHFMAIPMLYRPKSMGRVWLNGSNPLTPPIINPNYYGEEDDVDGMLAAIKDALKIIDTPAMKKINATLFSSKVPGCLDLDFGTDDYWRCSIKVMTYSQNHHVSTCKMGPPNDSTAVVSPELRVYGMRNLRVVDSSVLPEPPTGHTSAMTLMVGEKAADMIKRYWENGQPRTMV